MTMACSQPESIVVDDTVYIYYTAANFSHSVNVEARSGEHCKSGAALATFKSPIAFLAGDKRVGFRAMPRRDQTVRGAAPRVVLNAATWQKGTIRVEALTRDWQPIAGFAEPQARTVQGDARTIRFAGTNADLSKLIGKEIRLKFYMTRARPRDDAEQRRPKVGAGRQRVSVRPAG